MSHGKRAAPFSAFSETILGKMYADVKSVVMNALDDLKKANKKRLILMNFPYVAFAYAYSAKTAHPFQRNGALFRLKLSGAQLVD